MADFLVNVPGVGTVLVHGSQQEEGPSFLGFAKEAGKSLLRGAGLAGATLLERGFPPIGPPSSDPQNHGVRFRKFVDEKLPSTPNVFNQMLEGAGAGGLASPALMVPSMLSGMAGAGASDVAGKFLEGQDPRVQAAGKMAAGVVAGGGAAIGLGPRKAPPRELAERDKGILLGVGMNRIGPEVDVKAVANDASRAANALEKQLAQMGSAAFRGQLAGAPSIPARDVAAVYKGLRLQAENHPNPGMQKQIMEVADALLDYSVTGKGQRFITDPDTVSKALKAFKENSVAHSQTASSAQKFSQDQSRIAGAAEDDLGNLYFPLARANQASAQVKARVADPLRESPIGTLADSNPRVSDPTPVGRLTGAFADTSPQSVSDLMQLLRNQGVSSQAIARALAQKRLAGGPDMPEQALFGGPGAPAGQGMEAVFRAAGRNPNEIRLPLAASETRSRMVQDAANQVKEFGTVSPTGVSLRALVKPSWLAGIQEGRIYGEQLARLLRTASPQEIQALHRLSAFDPKVKAALITAGVVRGGMTNQDQDTSGLLKAIQKYLGENP